MLRCLLLWATMLVFIGCTPELAKITPAPLRVVQTPKAARPMAVMQSRAMASSVVIGPTGPSVILLPTAVKLQWEASPDESVVGYNLYFGMESRQYLTQISVSNSLQARLDGLTIGQDYFFAVTCYAADGVESDFSVELEYIIPQTLGLFLDPTGSSLQASPDLFNWSPRQASLDTNMWRVTIPPNTTTEFFRSIQ